MGTMCGRVSGARLVRVGEQQSKPWEGAMNRQIRVRVTRRPSSSRDTRQPEIDRRTPSGRLLPY
ncbi:hypothetical protein ACFYZ8_03680 [Streptomyces sp. NPDC001668]|uniref:hypothetical protein n=1 Tax=unclassified Streptomyces TaxID=2593676 RepID=UPI0036862608